MKIAIILGSFSVGSRPLDFWHNNIWESGRGLTGTDLTTVVIAKELAKNGHEVSLFTVHAQPHHKPGMWENVKLYNLDERFSIITEDFDAILSINEPNVLKNLPVKPLRICWQFLNDFDYCEPGFDEWVDIWLGVCEEHVEYLKKQNKTNAGKWQIVPLGCYSEAYADQRIPGRIVWTSSADRGLHWLLSQWATIKNAVPEAHLKIFYHFNYGDLEFVEENSPHVPHFKEMGQRIRYIKNALPKLKNMGVEHVGSISRKQMIKELNEASVFAYSCDPVVFSEGFSVSTLEALNSYTAPVIIGSDCLTSIYKNSGAIVIPPPAQSNINLFTQEVIKCLSNKNYADDVINKCRKFAQAHDWTIIVKKIENIIGKK